MIQNDGINETDNSEETEITLIDLFSVLLKHIKLIIITTLVGMIGVLLFSILSLVIPSEKSLYTTSTNAYK